MSIEKSRWIPRIGVSVSVLALIFQLIAFATDGWRIEGFDTTIDGDHYKSTSRSGVWYITNCGNNGDCETKSYHDIWLNSDEELDSYNYASLYIRKQVTLTLGLVLSIVCAILTVVALCRSMNDKRIRLVVIICSLLSGTFWLYEVGMELKLYDRQRKDADSRSTRTIYFPWSLFAALFGTVLILILCSIYIMIECKSEKSECKSERFAEIARKSERFEETASKSEISEESQSPLPFHVKTAYYSPTGQIIYGADTNPVESFVTPKRHQAVRLPDRKPSDVKVRYVLRYY